MRLIAPSGSGTGSSGGESPAMCNLYSNTTNVEAMRRLFDVAPDRDRLGNQPPLPGHLPTL